MSSLKAETNNIDDGVTSPESKDVYLLQLQYVKEYPHDHFEHPIDHHAQQIFSQYVNMILFGGHMHATETAPKAPKQPFEQTGYWYEAF